MKGIYYIRQERYAGVGKVHSSVPVTGQNMAEDYGQNREAFQCVNVADPFGGGVPVSCLVVKVSVHILMIKRSFFE